MVKLKNSVQLCTYLTQLWSKANGSKAAEKVKQHLPDATGPFSRGLFWRTHTDTNPPWCIFHINFLHDKRQPYNYFQWLFLPHFFFFFPPAPLRKGPKYLRLDSHSTYSWQWPWTSDLGASCLPVRAETGPRALSMLGKQSANWTAPSAPRFTLKKNQV